MNKIAKHIISLIIGCIALIYFYTLLHEGGHALVAIIYGGKVGEFVLGLNAHVQTSGATFTTFGEALLHSAGALLPVIFLIIALVVYKPKIQNELYHISYVFLSIAITSSLLAWIIVPLIALFALPPASDDTTKFLNVTGFHPLTVALTAALIIAALILFIYKKGLLKKVKEIYSKLRQANSDKVSKVFLTRLFIGITLIAIISAVGFTLLMSKPAFKTSLSMEVSPTLEDVKLPFKVQKSKPYSMDLKLTAKGILTDIQIYTEKGTLVYENICEWFTLGTSLNLEKGNYVFVLTFLKDPTAMQEHFEAMGYKFESDELKHLKEVYNTNNLAENNLITFSASIK